MWFMEEDISPENKNKAKININKGLIIDGSMKQDFWKIEKTKSLYYTLS